MPLPRTPLLALLLGCSPAPPAEVVFVRDGLVTTVPGEGRPVGGDRWLVERPWTPGEQVTVGGTSDTAPQRAECTALFSIDLGDVSRLVAAGGPEPDTALAFSPDTGALAVGSYTGEVLVLDGWTGAVRTRRRLAETAMKQVAWARDGGTLYAAEQSPDALLRALDPATLADRWILRLADLVGSSALPADDVWGLYSLPGAYGLAVLDDGDLLVVALHTWADAAGVHRNRAQVLRVGPEGTVRARWPEEPADATLIHPRLDQEGGLVVLAVGRSADGPPPADLPVGGVVVLDLATLAPVTTFTPEPLRPWFEQAFVWEALDVSRREGSLFLGLGDGRVTVVGLDGTPRLAASTGAPVLAGDVPIHASVGFGLFDQGGVLFTTSTTLIPWGAARPDLRPPTAHPAENTLFDLDMDGRVRWSWSGSPVLSGLGASPDGRRLVVGAGNRQADERRDLYGALVFDLTDPDDGRSGEQRLLTFCRTEGPVFFRQVLADDGRVAVAEHPYLAGEGVVEGAYRVTVLR